VSPTIQSIIDNRELKKALVITLSSAALLVASVGVYRAIHSPLFLVQVVEVTTQNADQISVSQAEAMPAPQGDSGVQPWTPVDADKISDLASIPVGERRKANTQERVDPRSETSEALSANAFHYSGVSGAQSDPD